MSADKGATIREASSGRPVRQMLGSCCAYLGVYISSTVMVSLAEGALEVFFKVASTIGLYSLAKIIMGLPPLLIFLDVCIRKINVIFNGLDVFFAHGVLPFLAGAVLQTAMVPLFIMIGFIPAHISESMRMTRVMSYSFVQLAIHNVIGKYIAKKDNLGEISLESTTQGVGSNEICPDHRQEIAAGDVNDSMKAPLVGPLGRFSS